MGNVLLKSTPQQEHYRHSCKASDYEAAVQALQLNRWLIDKRVCRSSGDKLLHVLARQEDFAQHLRDVFRILTEAMSQEGLSMQDVQRKVAKAANQRNNRGQTPLMLACEHGNVKCIEALLGAGADPWLGDNVVHRTCTHYAAGTGNAAAIEAVTSYVKSHPLLSTKRTEAAYCKVHDVPAASGMTPLHYAAWRRQVAAVVALTKENASLYTRSGPMGQDPECPICNEGSTPLHLAALKGSHGAVKALLKAYARQSADQQQADQDSQQQGGGRYPTGAQQQRQQLQLQPQQQRQYQQRQQGQQSHSPSIGPLVDPRTLLDCLGYTPFAIARSREHFYLLPDLNPLTPLSQVLAQDSPQDRAIGVPRLEEIAAKAAHSVLMGQINTLAQELEVTKLRRPTKIPATSIYAGIPAPPVNCHAALLPLRGGSYPSSRDASVRQARADASGRPSDNRHDGSTRNRLRTGSQHGSTLADSALLLANMLTAPRVSVNGEAGTGSKQPSVHGGRSTAQLQCSPEQLERQQGGSVRGGLTSAFSLRSSSAFAAQVEQEVSRHKSGVLGAAQELADRSHHLEYLQQMQAWDPQDLEETMHMARLHRLTRGVEGNDEEAQEVALLAVLSNAGSGPSTAVMLDARGRPAEGSAVTALTAATSSIKAASFSRPMPIQRHRSQPQDGADAAGGPVSFSSPRAREARLLAMVAEDDQPSPSPASRELLAGISGTVQADTVPYSLCQADEASTSCAPLVSLVSLSRQSSKVVGRVAMPADTAAGDVALARLVSMTRQPSQGFTGPGGALQSGYQQDMATLIRRVSMSRQASHSASACATDAGARSLLDQACEAAVAEGQSGAAIAPAVNPQLAAAAAPAAAPAMDTEEPEVCGVCLDSGDFVEMQACGHTMCVDCATELVRLHEYKAARCPLCRGIISGFVLPVIATGQGQ